MASVSLVFGYSATTLTTMTTTTVTYYYDYDYTVSQKNIPNIFDCHFKTSYQILIIFGTNTSDTSCLTQVAIK